MVVLRHLIGSDPSIEVADEETGAESAVTVLFDARPPKAALTVEQDQHSVVVRDIQVDSKALLSDVAEVTQVTRTKGIARLLSFRHWVIFVESNWVVAVVGLSVVALLICAIRLR
jgi:hypothetical protein